LGEHDCGDDRVRVGLFLPRLPFGNSSPNYARLIDWPLSRYKLKELAH
jgi:hypothetical protein